MKSTFIALLVFSLCLPVFTGCQTAQPKVVPNSSEALAAIEAAILEATTAKTASGKLIERDLEEVTKLYLHGNKLTDVRGLEIQMLELDWVKLRTKKGKTPPPIAYVHGELFGAGGLKATPDNPRGSRSKSLENRCKGKGEWNVYDVVCVDGVVKLSVNGKFVNGIRNVQYKKGYLCMESEGAEIHFRNLKIMELPPGITSPEQTAPLVK
jgi:hypothetical protein|tara:strand:- start:469 stop:1098 length:630 start_codon:yes stop_codon:yes gene_type:complete